MQAIIENEFLPALLGSKISLIGEYTGFKETVNPQVSHEFSAAAARLHGSVQVFNTKYISNTFLLVGNLSLVRPKLPGGRTIPIC